MSRWDLANAETEAPTEAREDRARDRGDKGARMKAFLGKQEVKDFYLARVRAHREADEIVQGVYWEHGKGCAVGCTIHSGNHAAYETELGIPRIIAKLEDGIFESLENDRSMLWPEQFLSAPAVGADLALVWPRFAVWLLVDPTCGVFQFAKSDRSKKAIEDVADGYLAVIKGEAKTPNWAELRAAAYAANAAYAAYAVANAAYAAADAAAAYAAYAAANAADAAYAAAYAADAYAAADAAAAAYAAAGLRKRGEFREAQANKLLELLSAAPVPETARNAGTSQSIACNGQ